MGTPERKKVRRDVVAWASSQVWDFWVNLFSSFVLPLNSITRLRCVCVTLRNVADGHLRRIRLFQHPCCDEQIALLKVFRNVVEVEFGCAFRGRGFERDLPPGLTKLTFNAGFSSTLDLESLPPTLRTLKFHSSYAWSIDLSVLPPSLTKLTCDAFCVKGCKGISRSLTKLSLTRVVYDLSTMSDDERTAGSLDNAKITSMRFPRAKNADDLQTLLKSHRCSQLRSLRLLEEDFMSEFDYGALPQSLRSLEVDSHFRPSFHSTRLPPTLTTLVFGGSFDEYVYLKCLPSTLLHLEFGDRFNQTVEPHLLPKQLRTITFGKSFDKDLTILGFPVALRLLRFKNPCKGSLKFLWIGRNWSVQFLTETS